MKVVVQWVAFTLIVIGALSLQSLSFEQNLRNNVGPRLTNLESMLADLQSRSGETPIVLAPSPSTHEHDDIARVVRNLEDRLGKMESAPRIDPQQKNRQDPTTGSKSVASDVSQTPQFQALVRDLVKGVLKEESDKKWEATSEDRDAKYEGGIRKELTNLGLSKQYQDELVKVYQKEANEWGAIYWNEYLSKRGDESFKKMTPEEKEKYTSDIKEKLRNLEASNDVKRRMYLTHQQFETMKAFEKKFWRGDEDQE